MDNKQEDNNDGDLDDHQQNFATMEEEQDVLDTNHEKDEDEDEEEDEDVVIVMDDLESLGYQKPLSLSTGGIVASTASNPGDSDSQAAQCNSKQKTAMLASVLKDGSMSDSDFTSSFNIELDSIEDKPWRKPGTDITDYFNYGFDELTWRMYCHRQKTLKEENTLSRKITVVEGGVGGSTGGGIPPKMAFANTGAQRAIPTIGSSTSSTISSFQPAARPPPPIFQGVLPPPPPPQHILSGMFPPPPPPPPNFAPQGQSSLQQYQPSYPPSRQPLQPQQHHNYQSPQQYSRTTDIIPLTDGSDDTNNSRDHRPKSSSSHHDQEGYHGASYNQQHRQSSSSRSTSSSSSHYHHSSRRHKSRSRSRSRSPSRSSRSSRKNR